MSDGMKRDVVVLVDHQDVELGVMEKMQAHEKALLHRAVSVFVFNSQGEWLLQRRAAHKYHSAGLWTNTCCTHPQPGEKSIDAARSRLDEEMGMEAPLAEVFDFIYCEALDNALTEHELDHVFVGVTDTLPTINVDEVMEYKYVSTDWLQRDIQNCPQQYTVWFRKIVDQVVHYL
jgi:isopentenyl-diphosphate Delta-isomerase